MAAGRSPIRQWGWTFAFDLATSMKRSKIPSAGAKAAGGRPVDEARSPFTPVLGVYRERLASPLAVQFFGTDEGHRVRMDGVMHRVWHRHEWLRPFFVR